jgi:peptide/nickel transport system substrate-binding protein
VTRAADVTIHLRQAGSAAFSGAGYRQWAFAQDSCFYSPYLAQVTQSMLPATPWNKTHNNDSLYNQANATPDEGLRKELLYQMQQYDFSHGGSIIPAFADTPDAYSTKITGYRTPRPGKPLGDCGFTRLAFTA